MAYCYLRDDETGFEFDRLEPPTNEPVQKYLNVWFDFAVNRLYFAGEELKEEPDDGFTLVCVFDASENKDDLNRMTEIVRERTAKLRKWRNIVIDCLRRIDTAGLLPCDDGDVCRTEIFRELLKYFDRQTLKCFDVNF